MRTNNNLDDLREFEMTDRNKRTLIALSSILAAAAIFFILWFTRRSETPLPNEKVVAMEQLAEKLSGPRYFNASVAGFPDADGPWIKPEKVRLQADRVILERHWGPRGRAELDRLISQLSEPEPSRMVGGYRIPLERLNLALDAIRE